MFRQQPAVAKVPAQEPGKFHTTQTWPDAAANEML